MPGPVESDVGSSLLEILPPAHAPRTGAITCECCRESKPSGDFCEDGCGICVTCLECDEVLIELEIDVRGTETPFHIDHLDR